MLELAKIIRHSDERFQSEIRKAKSSKNADRSRIERRIHEVYFIRLGRATLGVSQNIPLNDKGLSLAVSFPEVLFSKMLALGWNPTRQQKEQKEGQPELLTK